MNPTANNILIRTLSGLVLLAVVLGTVLLSVWSFGILLAVIGGGSIWEFYRIAAATGLAPQRGFGTALGIALIAGGLTVAAGVCPSAVLAAFIPLTAAVFIAELYRKKENPLGNIAVTLAGVLYAALPLALLPFVGIREAGDEILYRPWVILSYIFIVWSNDIGAFLTGSALGRHRLFERISPKKSWEGFAGGIVAAVGVAILSGRMQGGDPLLWGALGAVVAVSGVWGDLVESMFKRSVGIKDSGRMMPGHGGFLDRFDAMLISAPFVFVYFIIFTL